MENLENFTFTFYKISCLDIVGGHFVNLTLFWPKNSRKVQNGSRPKRRRFREKRCMRLFLRIRCKIHVKYQFWNSRPRVISICQVDMEWPKGYLEECRLNNLIVIIDTKLLLKYVLSGVSKDEILWTKFQFSILTSDFTRFLTEKYKKISR
jgi:hypothetical protein